MMQANVNNNDNDYNQKDNDNIYQILEKMQNSNLI